LKTIDPRNTKCYTNVVINISINNLEWDDWNRDHIASHAVTQREVEKAIIDPNSISFPTYGDRVNYLGRAGKRLLSIVLSPERYGKRYVVTARDMSKKERSYYRKV